MNHLSHLFRSIVMVIMSAGLVLTLSGAIDDDDGEAVIQGLGISDSFGKWSNGVITWSYNTDPADVNGRTPPVGFTDDNVTLARMQAGLDEWERVCGIRFVSLGVDDSRAITATDGVVVVQWETLGGPAGLAGPSLNPGQDRTGPGHYEYTDGALRLDPDVFSLAGLAPDDVTNRLI